MNARLPNSANSYLGAFRRVSGILPGHNLDWLRKARKAAIERFINRGFPTLRDEDWKYTSVATIESTRFNLLPEPQYNLLTSQVATLALPDAHLLVFVNGYLEPGLSRIGRLPPGTVLGSVGYMLEEHPDRLREALVLNNANSPFFDLNLAFMTDGAYVVLPPGATIKSPVQLIFIASEGNLAIQPRNLVLAAPGSSATIVEHHAAAWENSYFTNTVTDILLGPGARIEYHKLQQESPTAFHIAAVNVTQEAKSNFVSSAVAFGARLARVNISVKLQGEEAVCHLDGLYVTDDRQHIDHHTRIDHLQPRCTSRECYKGVLAGASRAVFNGRVLVHPGAQGSDAWQANHNLLLSENVEIDTKPQLEIHADDVKCSHGATVGQLDEAQVFYLRSRAMDEDEARRLLTHAFAREVIDRIRLPSLQDKLDVLLQEKLKELPC